MDRFQGTPSRVSLLLPTNFFTLISPKPASAKHNEKKKNGVMQKSPCPSNAKKEGKKKACLHYLFWS